MNRYAAIPGAKKQLRRLLYGFHLLSGCIVALMVLTSGGGRILAEDVSSAVDDLHRALRFAATGRGPEAIEIVDRMTATVRDTCGVDSYEHRHFKLSGANVRRIAQLPEADRQRVASAVQQMRLAQEMSDNESDSVGVSGALWRVYEILSQVLGKDDSLAMALLLRSIALDESFGEQDNALEMVERQMECVRRYFGEENRTYAACLILRARVYSKRRALDQSERTYRDAEAVLKAVDFKGGVLSCQSELASVLIASKRYAEAEHLARGAVDSAVLFEPSVAQQEFPPAKMAAARYQLGRSLRGMGQQKKAVEEIRQAVSLLDSLKRKPPTLHLEATREYAQILREVGREAEAEALDRRIRGLERTRQQEYQRAGWPRELPKMDPKARLPEWISQGTPDSKTKK